jgi:hypothetical protein
MSHKTQPKMILLLLITLLLLPTTATSLTPQIIPTETDTIEKNLTPEEIEHILTQHTQNDSGRYITISAGIRATSFFLKIPKLLTQRGIAFIAEIKYRSPLAFTLIIHNTQNGIQTTFEHGTHRLIVFGFGHAAFSRPHIGSFGRYIGFSKTKPIVF